MTLSYGVERLLLKNSPLKCNKFHYKGDNEENIANNERTMQKSTKEEPKQ